MFDAITLMTCAGVSWLGWLVGMLRKRAQFWVIFLGPIGLLWLTWYFFLILSQSQPQLFAGGLQAGKPTVAAMIGGVCALLAKPKPERPHRTEGDGGAQSA